MRVRYHAPGLIDLLGTQIDSVVLDPVPEDITFAVAIRVVGTEQDFEQEHAVDVVPTAPDLRELGRLSIPIEPGVPPAGRIAGYELNRHVAAQVVLPADTRGGYDLAFGLDGVPDHRHRATISVLLKHE